MNAIEFLDKAIELNRLGEFINALNPQTSGALETANEYLVCLDYLYKKGDEESLDKLHEITRSNSPLYVLNLTYRPAKLALEGKLAEAKAVFEELERAYQTHENALTYDLQVYVKKFLRQGRMIDLAFKAQDHQAFEFEITTSKFSDHDYFVLASCNDIYFKRFGEGFLSSLGGETPCHIHLLNPESDFEDRVEQLSKTYPNLRITTEVVEHNATIYACRRFQLAGALMDHYGLPVWISDIDVVLSDQVKNADMSKSDLALFKVTKTINPLEIMHLSLSYVNQTERAKRFMDILGRYLTAFLASSPAYDESWGIDQLGYLTAETLSGAGVSDLHELCQAELADFQQNQSSSFEEKYDLRMEG
ncbi:hypothetical protein MTBPR1_50139 [Candidatus Terasakiella magnetica]|uniref:Uncharacterized protein n=1 Tax=Candidatus Terasakiella magnetica TaxID=1867952 RepID=A0A1C3RJH3_9PROT|nr:hypothetical protein [Candidatus Terasakiella magnetica]SCA57383.1 hypothetical protein MTBPR1_50139 [Candidatus Terasakiella magnetica]